jgi:hypothetical protein
MQGVLLTPEPGERRPSSFYYFHPPGQSSVGRLLLGSGVERPHKTKQPKGNKETELVATQEQYLDFDIAEELPEASFRWVGKVIAAGAQMPPARKQAKIGGTPRPELHITVEPLSYRNDSDRSRFEDDFEHGWYALQNKNGEQAKAGSNLDYLKRAFAKLGFPITNNASCAAFVGKIFFFEYQQVKRTFGKGEDATENVSWILVPVEGPLPSYNHTGPVQVVKRPRGATAAPTAASFADNADVALPKLRDILNGKEESDYFTALTESGDADVLRAPYIVEASSDARALTVRMIDSGLMRQVDGKLVA